MRCDAACGLRPTLLHDPDVFRHSASPLWQLPRVTVPLRGFSGGRSEQQNRSDIKQRAAPSRAPLEGRLGRLARYERLDGREAEWRRQAQCQRKARRALDACTHFQRARTHTHNSRMCTDERNSHMATQSVGDGGGKKKKTQTKSNAHMAVSIIMPSEIA